MIPLLSWIEGGCLSKLTHRGLFDDAYGVVMLTIERRIGSPQELYRAQGDFYSMVKHSGEDEELRAM